MYDIIINLPIIYIIECMLLMLLKIYFFQNK